ncbi:MAG: hypothetical protein KZQ90_05625 [Candidatus Thiodiazotropha sp. (ex Codakia rugifera)]|nr:hypothetical protein [Candidatus Thiodiazotropha sp. (ex Codakia rugifera)]
MSYNTARRYMGRALVVVATFTQWEALVKHCNAGTWPERASLRARR